jgi:SET domain-containing protein
VEKYVVNSSGIHGTGLFARNPISEGEQIVEYIGKKISKAESLLLCEWGNPFIFDLDEEWDIDGSVEWNPARFANHSCSPNCEVQNDDGRLWMIALRAIAPGEELTYNYGYDFAEFREHPCACGAPECVGYIVVEEFHDTVRRILPKASEGVSDPATVPPVS